MMSYIEESRQHVIQSATTPPAPPTVIKSNTPPRRMSTSGLSPFLQKRDKPGRLSLRPSGGRHSASTRVFSIHGENQLQDPFIPTKPTSFDDADIQAPKRSGSLRLFKQKSYDKKKTPCGSSSLSKSSTAADFLVVDNSTTFKKSASFSDKHSALTRGVLMREASLHDDMHSPLESKLSPISPKALVCLTFVCSHVFLVTNMHLHMNCTEYIYTYTMAD